MSNRAYALAQERVPAGLIFVELLFLRSYPRRDLVPTLSVILEQAVVIAENHHLLLPVPATFGHLPTPQSVLVHSGTETISLPVQPPDCSMASKAPGK
jgi:hypothetical protein